ncbi:hypothetical protein [Glacieibacterium frigidum]|uniref:Uncharacterized protein n=1 Tax=Glacieibacterium frigidum TaxID=2593303 RepID=A0A552U7V1_9SPHN|nr:hypothetical protein [Glacieibacterium frigidum]TRW14294.1 hypothetical protein FMM06_11295 [Glacieibacterium frigidum]
MTALQDRLAAMRERARQRAFVADRADYVRSVPVLATLEANGDAYDSFDYRRIRGPLNEWAHDPARWPIVVEACRDLPAGPAERDAAIVAEVARVFGDVPELTVILRRESLVLEVPVPVFASRLAVLIASAGASEIGVTAPPFDRIIEVHPPTIAIGTLPPAR